MSCGVCECGVRGLAGMSDDDGFPPALPFLKLRRRCLKDSDLRGVEGLVGDIFFGRDKGGE